MSKVLLISVNRCESPCAVFPLGLAYLDTALHQAGHSTQWFDFEVEQRPLPEALSEFQPDFVGISLRNVDDVAINKREMFFTGLAALCDQIRRHWRGPIILGGSGFSIFPIPLLEFSGANYGIQGQGERSLVALLKALENKKDVSEVPGLVFRQGDRIVINPGQNTPLDEAGGPPRRPAHLVDFYLRKSSMLNVQTQRGCAFACCYCTYPLIEGNACLRRSPEAVAEEFALLERLGAKYAFIVDSVFNTSAAHAAGICEALLRKGLNIRWGCFLRPQHLSPDLMRLMARAGLSHIEFGTDSFCDEVLQAYGKHFTFEDIYQSSELARVENVDYCHFLICGGPGETRKTLEAGFLNSQRLQQAIILPFVGMRIYPGTPLFAYAQAQSNALTTGDLLQPRYYLSPELTEDEIFTQLREFARRSPNWVVDEAPPIYLQAVERLRAIGIVGPLWSYLALMQKTLPGLPWANLARLANIWPTKTTKR